MPQLRLSTAKLANTYFKNNSKNSQCSSDYYAAVTCFVFHLRLINVAIITMVILQTRKLQHKQLGSHSQKRVDLGSNPDSLIPEHWAGVGTPWFLSSPKHSPGNRAHKTPVFAPKSQDLPESFIHSSFPTHFFIFAILWLGIRGTEKTQTWIHPQGGRMFSPGVTNLHASGRDRKPTWMKPAGWEAIENGGDYGNMQSLY